MTLSRLLALFFTARASCALRAAALAAAVAGGCAATEPGITPARDRFYFPTGLALDPTRAFLYVANSNADLKYNGATLNVVDLRALPDDLGQIAAQVKSGKLGCEAGTTDKTVWECPEAQLIQIDATLRLGNYPSDVRVSGDGKRLFVPVRGQNYLMWASIVERAAGQLDLRCDDTAGGCRDVATSANCEVWDCDEEHRIAWSEDRRRALPTEPFGIELNELTAVHVAEDGTRRTCKDRESPPVPCSCGPVAPCQSATTRGCCIAPPAESHLYVTHLAGGEVSLFSSDASRVRLHDFRGGFFAAAGDIRGAFSVAARTPGDPEGLVYVSSRVDSTLASFVVAGNRRIVEAVRAPLGGIAPGTDARGIAFGAGGRRLYVVDRLPAALVAVDMSPGDQGWPKQEPLWAVELCAEPSVLRVAPDPLGPARGDPDAELAYVVCFGASEIVVVDLRLGTVVDEIIVGRGPNQLVLDHARRRAFIANFLENTVGVIDLDPSHATYRRMVMRIGRVTNLLQH